MRAPCTGLLAVVLLSGGVAAQQFSPAKQVFHIDRSEAVELKVTVDQPTWIRLVHKNKTVSQSCDYVFKRFRKLITRQIQPAEKSKNFTLNKTLPIPGG